MNGQLRVSSKIKRMSSLVVHVCSPMNQEFEGSLSCMRPFIKKKRSRRRNVHLIRIPSQGQTGPTVPCLLQHFLKKEEILKWGMKWEQEHPQGQEAETLRGPNFIKAAVLPLSAMYTTGKNLSYGKNTAGTSWPWVCVLWGNPLSSRGNSFLKSSSSLGFYFIFVLPQKVRDE